MRLWIGLVFLLDSVTPQPATMMAVPRVFSGEAACLMYSTVAIIPHGYGFDCIPIMFSKEIKEK